MCLPIYGPLAFSKMIFIVTKQKFDEMTLAMWEESEEFTEDEYPDACDYPGLEVKRKQFQN